MARAVRDPRLGPAVREAHRDEGRAQVVDADRLALRAPLEELGAVDAGELQMRAQLGAALPVAAVGDAASRLVDEDERAAVRLPAELPPRDERARNARVECPCARVIALVLVERDRAAREVDVAPCQVPGLAPAHALAIQEAVEESVRERDLARGE